METIQQQADQVVFDLVKDSMTDAEDVLDRERTEGDPERLAIAQELAEEAIRRANWYVQSEEII